MMGSVVCHHIVGMRQILNMATSIVEAASAVAIQPMAIHFHACELAGLEKRIQGGRIGEIGASQVAHLLTARDTPLQIVLGAVQQIQISIIEKSCLWRKGLLKALVIGISEFIDSLELARR